MTFASKTEEQQQNLRTLLSGLVHMYGTSDYHPNFNMRSYQSTEELITDHTCDTSACVLGHGPIFGITKPLHTCWDSYSENSFGVDPEGRVWCFLFSLQWYNDIQEAIARLKMYISGFDPENEDWRYYDLYAGVSS